jgi:hypothetical protein
MVRQHAPQARWLTAVCAGLLLAGLTGCSGQSWGKITGKVTVNDKPVTSGRITFMHDDGRTALAEIKPDGSYSLEKIPVGKLKVGIESMNFAAYEAKMPKRKEGGKMQDPNDPGAATPTALTKSGATPWVPTRYNEPKSSGLTADVKDGDNKIDFPLKSI